MISEHFDEILILGNLSPNLLAPGIVGVALRQLPLATSLLDAQGCAPVAEIIEYSRCQRRQHGRTLVLTDSDLVMPACRHLFGFADRHARVAVISTARLGSADNQEQLSRRLHNEIAHEAGHLQGLNHCANPRCVMKPVSDAQELDDRGNEPCGQCPRAPMCRQMARKSVSTIAALSFLALCTLGLNLVATLIAGPPLRVPFT